MRTWGDYREFWRKPPPWAPDVHEAFLVPATTLLRSEVADATIDHVVLLRFEMGSSPRLLPLTAGRAAAMCSEQIRDIDELRLQAISEICRRAGTALLTYGSVDEAIPVLQRFAGAAHSGAPSESRSTAERMF